MLHPEEDNDYPTARQTDGAAFGDGVWAGFWRLLSHPMVSGAGALAASQYVGASVNLLTSIAAARLLGPSSYGVAALIMAYPNLVWSLTSVKSASVTTRYLAGFVSTRKVSEFESMCKLGYVVDLLASFVAFAVIGLSAIWLTPHVVDRPGATTVIVAYSSSFVFLLSERNGDRSADFIARVSLAGGFATMRTSYPIRPRCRLAVGWSRRCGNSFRDGGLPKRPVVFCSWPLPHGLRRTQASAPGGPRPSVS